MTDAALYKTSIFVHCTDSIIFNDLTHSAYYCDRNDVALLRQLSEEPVSLQSLALSADVEALDERLQFYLEERLLVLASQNETGDFMLIRADIETCRQCNARCKYCPQSVSPKSRAVMPLDRFELILSKMGDTPLEWVALNHYGEPLLDPFFRERVRMLRERAMPLGLYTNGTLLKESVIDFLSEGGVEEAVFNFPSIDPTEWSHLMQLPEKSYWRARRAIEYYLTNGAQPASGITISVNIAERSQEERVRRIEEHFSALGKMKVRAEYSNSRAGSIQNELVSISSREPEKRYAGCERFAHHLHVSWEGKVFLCCQDYEQSVVLGDLTTDSISAIMSTPSARQLRAELYGLEPMAAGRLCVNCNKLRRLKFPVASGPRAA